ncbi:MAG: ABC transporter permease subunit [Clostridia bacterium]|nr:ABC transporter permease subunit [Clostridia bacterium]
MTLRSSFRKPFWGLFFQSLKLSVWFPLLAFAGRIIPTFFRPPAVYDESIIGYFWNEYLAPENLISFPIFSPIFAIITAVLLFNFAWSKKKTNVLFSFGMTRTQIYSAKLLAGILPLIVLMGIAAGFEITLNLFVGYKLSARYLLGAAFIFLNAISPYILCFCVSSMVIANTSNVIEGGAFTFITMAAPSVLRQFLAKLFCAYTLGASEIDIDKFLDVLNLNRIPQSWNWTVPFLHDFSVIFENYYNYGEAVSYFRIGSLEEITVYDWSGFIMSVIYTAIAVAVGLYLFEKKKNENAATFGRSRNFNEFCAVVAGFFIAATLNQKVSLGEGKFTEFLPLIPFFFLGYFVFKQIFGYKRLRELKRSFKRLPIYTAGLFACFLCCYLGFFGYSSYVPKADDVMSVSVSTPFFKNLDDRLADDSRTGLKPMNTRDKFDERETNINLNGYHGTYYFFDEEYYDMNNNYTATFYDPDEIALVTDVHKSFAKDGHISGSDDNAQGTSVVITYRLKNNTLVVRSYYRKTEETAQKLLKLNDTKAVNNEVDIYFGTYGYEYEYLNDNYKDNSEVYNGNFRDKSFRLYATSGYLFPKDMSAGFKFGYNDEELFNALREDIKAQSAQEHYHHSAEDELGVLTFMDDSDFILYSGVSEKLSEKLGGDYITASWNINSPTAKSFVITKDMVNTLNYFEKRGLMKYFENVRTVEDIRHVKTATLGELYGENQKHLNMPLFYGAFKYYVVDTENGFDNSYFSKTKAQKITDKAEIQTLLDKSVLFGYCSNDSKIVEITYNDGIVATVMIPDSQ